MQFNLFQSDSLTRYPMSWLTTFLGQRSNGRNVYMLPSVEVFYYTICLESVVNAPTLS